MKEIEVRKPRWFGYSRRIQRWQDSMPDNGDRIRLTWLPCNNAWPEPNCYIGSEGTVFDMNKAEASFCLKMDSGATLVHGSGDFNYIKLNT